MPTDDLVTMTADEYADYLRSEPDERELSWMTDGLATLFQTIDPLTLAQSNARIRALGFPTIDQIPF
jgi:hypothetical protein